MSCSGSQDRHIAVAQGGRWRLRCLGILIAGSAFLAGGAPSAMANWHSPVDLASGDPSQAQGVGTGGTPAALSGSGVATVLYGKPAPTGSQSSSYPYASYQYLSRSRPAGSSVFGPPEVVRQFPADQYGVDDPRLVSDAQGNLTAAWFEFRGQSPYTYSVVAARRPVGGSWSAPTIIHSAPQGMTVGSLTRLVSGPDGGVGLTWQDCKPNYNQASSCQEQVGLLPHGATTWAVSQLDLQSCNQIAGSALALGGGDLAAVTFATPECDQYGNPTQDTAKAAVTTVASTAFGSVHSFDDGTMADRSQAITFDPSGHATALWSTSHPDGTASTLQVATSNASGWDPATTLPGSDDAVSGQLGSDDTGNLTAVWTTSGATSSTVQAASRPAGGSWTAAHQLAQATNSELDTEHLDYYPQLRTDPNGESVALWDTFTPTSDGSRGPSRLYLAHASSTGVWDAPQVVDTEQGIYGYAQFAPPEGTFAAEFAFVAGVDTFVAWNRLTYTEPNTYGYPNNETIQATWATPDTPVTPPEGAGGTPPPPPGGAGGTPPPAPEGAGGTPPTSGAGVRTFAPISALPLPKIFVSYDNAPDDPYMSVNDESTLHLAANDAAFISYGCNVGQPAGHRVSGCQMTAYGPDGSVTPVGSGAADADLAGANLPTAYPAICATQTNACQYTVRVDATNTDGVRTGLGFRYFLSAPASTGSETAALNGSINGQLSTIDSAFASLAQGYKTLYDGAHNPICFIARNGQVIAAGSAAGSGKIIAAGSGNIIAAGSGNIIAAGSYNFQIVNGSGQTVGIIAAGSGNIQVIAADGVTPAGSGNIIAAGSGNIIAAGSGNIVSTFGGGIIAAGAYNLLPRDGASFGPQFAAAALPVSGLASAGSLIGRIDTASLASGASASATRAIAARSRRATPIARGKVVLGFRGEKAGLALIFTRRGKQLIATLARQNELLRRKHKRLHTLTLNLTESFTPTASSKAITLARRFTITPGGKRRR